MNTTEKQAETARKAIFEQVLSEIERAEKKRGSNNHLPSLDPVLINRSAQRMCEEYEIPTPERAQKLCNTAFKRGQLTHAHIVNEEFSEVVGCMDNESEMREELIQVIAMCFNWVMSIDSKHVKVEVGNE